MDILNDWGQLLIPQGRLAEPQLWQLIAIALVLLFGTRFLGARFRPKETATWGPLTWLRLNLGFLLTWLFSLALFWILQTTDQSTAYVRFFVFLGGLWLVIGLLTSLIRDLFWARSLATLCYVITTAHALGNIDGIVQSMQDLQLKVGSFSISAWGFVSGILTFGFALWVTLGITRIIEVQIEKVPRLTASLKVLISKLIRILLICIAGMVALSSMGVDLTSLTVLGGAVGLGLGFGLQKVVSNFVSGIILLLDNSIKPGDVIEIEGSYGWINNLRARYASVITRDGTEHLIPNEDLITQRVINWSFTDELVRIRVPIGVSYNADPHECIRLILEATHGAERVLKDPAPVCLLKGFGDSSVDLELRFWVGDPANGVSNIRSKVLLKVWDIFKENNIEIPFPQRDLHIRSSEVLTVPRNAPDPD